MEDEEKQKPDWENFETYKGPPEEQRFPKWCYRLLDGFMVCLGLVVIFCISGALLFLITSRNSRVALAETPTTAMIRFAAGGCFGVGAVLYCYFRKR